MYICGKLPIPNDGYAQTCGFIDEQCAHVFTTPNYAQACRCMEGWYTTLCGNTITAYATLCGNTTAALTPLCGNASAAHTTSCLITIKRTRANIYPVSKISHTANYITSEFTSVKMYGCKVNEHVLIFTSNIADMRHHTYSCIKEYVAESELISGGRHTQN